MTFEITPSVIEDIEDARLSDIELRTRFGDNGDWIHERFRSLIGRGPAFTARVDGRVIACAGVVIYWPGVGEGWFMGSNRDEWTQAIRMQIHRATKTHLKAAIRDCDLRRVEVSVAADFEVGLKWAKALGMTPEGVRRKYAPDGSDSTLFAWTRS